MGYLKAVGILRLVSAVDPESRGRWSEGSFRLSPWDRAELVDFFIHGYCPTPVVSPWNKGSGFWDHNVAGKALDAIGSSRGARLAPYRATIDATRNVLLSQGFSEKLLKDKSRKAELLRALRSSLPDASLDWLDATVSVAETPQYSPLLGTGGNDGRLDFVANFMQRLPLVMPLNEDGPVDKHFDLSLSRAWLTASLFSEGAPPMVEAAVGQFDPGGVGGPNGTAGFEGSSLVNPWDFVLLVEGSMALAGSVARRLGPEARSKGAFPFTVAATAGGSGTLADADAGSTRAEIWLPLWDHPASYRECALFFGEGRAQVGRRQARSGVDFVRALSGLGVDRGISQFVRFGFTQRSGKNYLAANLGTFRVRQRSSVHLIDELDLWLRSLRAVAGTDSPHALRAAVRRINDAIFTYCSGEEAHGERPLQNVLAAVGRAERLLCHRYARGPKDESPLSEHGRPLPKLSPAWFRACDDGSPEFHIASALASISDRWAGSMRENIDPVERRKERFQWSGSSSPVRSEGRDLTRFLLGILERRLREANRQKTDPRGGEEAVSRDVGSRPRPPWAGCFRADISHLEAFLFRQTDDQRILDLLYALSAVAWPHSITSHRGPSASAPVRINPAYATLKLLFLPVHPRDSTLDPIWPDPKILGRLKANDCDRAVELARQHLFAHGVTPLAYRRSGGAADLHYVGSPDGERLGAALLIPVGGIPSLAGASLVPDKASEKG